MKGKTGGRIFAIIGILLVIGIAATFLLMKSHPELSMSWLGEGGAAVSRLLESHTPKFWISFVACVIALCANILGLFKSRRNSDSPSSGVLSIAALYYVLAVIAAILFGYYFFDLNLIVYGVIHLALFVIFLFACTARIVSIFGIIFVVVNAATFLCVKNYTPKFWISYTSCAVAFWTNCYCMYRTGRDIDTPSSGLFTFAAVPYAIAVIIFVLFGHRIFSLGTILYGFIHVVLFAIFLVGVIVVSMGHGHIRGQDKSDRKQIIKAKLDTERVTQLIETAKDLPEDVCAKAQKILHPVEEKLRYSDPMQSKETADQAREMESALDELEEAMDSLLSGQADLDLLTKKANAAIRKIDAYNRAKKMMK